MPQERRETVTIRQESDLLTVRRLVRQTAAELGFRTLGQTRLATAASELARNTLIHGGGGSMVLETCADLDRRGISLSFVDAGKGIEDIELALSDGFTTGSGMGLGLSGAKRLMDEFEIESTPGEGTRVKVVIWT